MKKILLVLLIFTGCKKEAEILSVEVYSVDELIEMPFRLHPNRFFYNFSDDEELKNRTISSADSVTYVAKILGKMKPDSACTSVDTRAVLLLKYATHTDTVGGNSSCLQYQGKTYQTPPELSRLFWGKSVKIP